MGVTQTGYLFVTGKMSAEQDAQLLFMKNEKGIPPPKKMLTPWAGRQAWKYHLPGTWRLEATSQVPLQDLPTGWLVLFGKWQTATTTSCQQKENRKGKAGTCKDFPTSQCYTSDFTRLALRRGRNCSHMTLGTEAGSRLAQPGYTVQDSNLGMDLCCTLEGGKLNTMAK